VPCLDDIGCMIKGNFSTASFSAPSGMTGEFTEGVAVSVHDADVNAIRLATGESGFLGRGSETTRRGEPVIMEDLALLEFSSLRSRRKSLLPISQSAFLLFIGIGTSECLPLMRLKAALDENGSIGDIFGDGVGLGC
jgi:hypothetical protein